MLTCATAEADGSVGHKSKYLTESHFDRDEVTVLNHCFIRAQNALWRLLFFASLVHLVSIR